MYIHTKIHTSMLQLFLYLCGGTVLLSDMGQALKHLCL